MEDLELEPDTHESMGERPGAFGGVPSKIVLLVFLATFLTAMLLSWVSIESAGSSLRGMVDRLHPLALDHAAARLAPWIQSILLELERAAHHSPSDPSRSADGSAARLDGLAVFGDDGGVVRRFGVAPEAARAALDAPGGIAVIELAPGSFGLAIAPHEGAGERHLVGVVSLDRVVPLLEVALPSEETLIALVDGDGRVLARAGRAPGDGHVEHLDLEPFRLHGGLQESTIGGVSVIGATRRIDLLGWQVAILTPFDAAYGAVLTVVARVFLIDLAIIALLSFVAYLVAARVMKPIRRLSEAVRRGVEDGTALEIPETAARDEIGVLSRTFSHMVRQQKAQREEIEEANRHLLDRNVRLEQANEVLSQLSITDGLTKLHNHRFFQDHLTREIRRVGRTGEPLSILLLDIDDFKRLNDRLGHAAGDEILMRIGQILVGGVRASDLCARYGGEEFVILAPNTDVLGAYRLAENLRREIAESSFIVDDSMRPLRATVSVGVATFDGNRKRFFQKADQALYRAKADGKDCVVIHDDDELAHGVE